MAFCQETRIGSPVPSLWPDTVCLEFQTGDEAHRDRRTAVGYSAIGCTVSREPSSDAVPSPFRSALPYPELDPRHRQAGPSSGPAMLQISRHHMRLHDPKTQLMHCLVSPSHTYSPDPSQTGANANTLRDYDLLSVQPMDDKALQIACTDLSNPGPNQVEALVP